MSRVASAIVVRPAVVVVDVNVAGVFEALVDHGMSGLHHLRLVDIAMVRILGCLSVPEGGYFRIKAYPTQLFHPLDSDPY